MQTCRQSRETALCIASVPSPQQLFACRVAKCRGRCRASSALCKNAGTSFHLDA
ncbi:hypothetical protein AZ54_20610 [Xanthomonas oryzae pv. oryzae PXO86]|uniref:Uncharacterized protein n=1 Tax=Xanthomonas oryzae pv. oryzae (strain PXO99A) TaxID=360094 RepID=A0A0K0GQ07_XANOP|nr:hypothetical protein PXO_02666 [Xanthomonas oryzae pv. oryzae PXO99A]AJQ85647.1 hypothetical protein AZ54_20610 [Xanthomonas oryzae pv. oryzae PXO86]